MNNSFLKKYQPTHFSDFIIDENIINVLNILLKQNDINVLFVGNYGCGKTTLIEAVMNEYYGNEKPELNDILYINNLKDQGIQYYRTELKTFCQTKSSIKNKKKCIVLDDIDNINEQGQQVFRNCIDKYKNNVHFICSCTDIQKVIESIQSRCLIIKLDNISKDVIHKIFKKITENENIEYSEDAVDCIVKLSNNSIRQITNFLEKFKILEYPITNETIKTVCTNISFPDFEKYNNFIFKERDLKSACDCIFNIYYKGYSVMDILDSYFIFIKLTDTIEESIKYKIIKLICKFIAIFHKIHESKIELAIFTNNLMKISNK